MTSSRVPTKKKIVLLSCLTLLLFVGIQLQPVKAQSDEEWSRTYRGENLDEANSLVQTSDSGYALAGRTDSFGAGEENFWLVKTDPQGNEEWSRTFGGENLDEANSLVQTSDGGYALAGWTESYGGGRGSAWLVKAKARYEPRYELSASAEPSENSSVLLDPSGGVYEEGENVTVTADPSSGYEFDRWSGDVPRGKEDEESITITMDSNKELTAHFVEKGGGGACPYSGSA